MLKHISLEEAWQLLLNQVAPLSTEDIELWDAQGRVLGTDIYARRSLPDLDRSAVDGYALRAEAVQWASEAQPVRINVADKVLAGLNSAGCCVPINTGDQIPMGADSVIRLEDVVEDSGQILISTAVQPGANIIPRGEDVISGALIAHRGTRISPALVAVLAGQGINRVPVYHQAKVTIITTGEELADPAEEYQAGKIYNSGLYGLHARCRQLGAQTTKGVTAPDNAELIAAAITEGLKKSDLVVTTGGVSVGRTDMVESALNLAEAGLIFHGLALKPGSPTLAAVKDGKLIIGFSGNPAAAMVSFELVAVPILNKLMGLAQVLPSQIQGIMAEGFDKPSPQRRFLRARLLPDSQGNRIQLTGTQGNSVLSSMIGCNLLVDIPEGSGAVTPGQLVTGWLIT